MQTILVPPLLCSPQVYAPVVDTAWSYGAVTIADTRRDDTIAGMAARLLRDAPQRFALLGTSMGGYVALEVIRQAPGRVAGLALVSTSARADSSEQLAARLRQSQLVARGRFDELVDAAFRGVVAERHEADAELLRTWRNMAATVGAQDFMLQQAAVVARADSRDLLARISCPTFVIHGAEDRLIPVESSDEIAAGVSGAALRLVAEAGHFLFLEQPAAAAAVVDEFLATVSEAVGNE
ncbi:alpha/beta fold hydrolase [Gryllotalpicola reticulitermitis]|uniref:Alpha/beta fold hydrolase n=1 Tax=Gryllotalpicola reticulitermitis TaxID=1184153 RepID=A0ABV8QAT6_9MICO